jgi:hypothetical protein
MRCSSQSGPKTDAVASEIARKSAEQNRARHLVQIALALLSQILYIYKNRGSTKMFTSQMHPNVPEI